VELEGRLTDRQVYSKGDSESERREKPRPNLSPTSWAKRRRGVERVIAAPATSPFTPPNALSEYDLKTKNKMRKRRS